MDGSPDSLLFSALVNELRLPLLQIARLSEFESSDSTEQITLISGHALKMVDAYNQAISFQASALEPTNLAVVLQETAHSLTPYAKANGYNVEVDNVITHRPVIAHQGNLQTMLLLLATSLMNSPDNESTTDKRLLLAGHRMPSGVAIGAFSNQNAALAGILSATRSLHGRAQQAVPELGHAGSASLAIADRLSEQMAIPLKSLRHGNLTGIGSLLTPSRQLHFVV